LFDNANYVSVFFEDGTMHVKSPVDTLRNYAVITGSGIHDQHAKFWKKEGDIVRQQKAVAAEFNTATPEQLQSPEFISNYETKTKELAKRRDSLVAAEIKNYPNTLVSSMAFYSQMRNQPDSAVAASMVKLFSKEYLQSKEGQMMIDAVKEMGKAAEPVVTINAREAAPDFEQNDTTGKPIQLSSLKGKYVLVDFWASWCVPCRKVNPDLVKMYEKYRGEKFTILGVSLDENKAKWIEAINKDKLDWHHVSDLKGWQNAVAKQYGIQGIPQNLLLDPNGKVLFKNLPIDALDSELKKLLNN
jgi:thiol-disulfide isomerase/thioredoxin